MALDLPQSIIFKKLNNIKQFSEKSQLKKQTENQKKVCGKE